MIISTKKGTPKEELEKIVDKFEKQGLDVTLITGKDYNVFGLVGDTTKIDERDVLANPWIDNVTRVSAPYKRANRLFHPADSIIDCGGVKIGRGEKIAVMAGPCSIEGEEQALRIANGVKAGGASLFRGGAYKPRTSPYSFQGLETEGILDMVKAREATGMPIVSELMSEDRIPEFEEYVDVVQIGARNMQNFQLLKAVGKMHKPVLLKRGLCNTSRSGSCPQSISWPAATSRSFSASGASAPLRSTPATPSTSPLCPSSTKRPICPSSWTPATPPARPIWWSR